MRAGHHLDRGSRRRIDHAHRVRRPVGAIGDEESRTLGRRRRIRPSVVFGGFIASFLVAATVAVALQPWQHLPGSAAGARQTGGIAAATTAPAPPAGGGGSAPTLGPHGDLVGAGKPPNTDIARWSDVRHAHAQRPLPARLLSGYRWPITNARITNSYGLGRSGSFVVDGRTFHDGLDISSFCGARITAAHDGVVLGAGRRTEGLLGWVGNLEAFRAKLEKDNAWGRQAITVVIDDGNGYRSIYAHLGLTVVERGEKVRAGDLLGYEGASGNATGCHLHYALFSPREEATLALDPKIARKNKLPAAEIARIDPLLVLPPPATAEITWGWGAR